MIVSLIGYRGTGKSSVGKLLAEQLDLPFFDSDEVITQEAGRTIADIFASEGEAFFRQLESQAAQQLMQQQDAVISWGGGVVLSELNREIIRRSGKTVWLQASAEVLNRRLNLDAKTEENRPALTDLDPLAEIRLNLAKRDALYRSCADIILDTDTLDVQQIVQMIVEKINN